MFHDSFIANLKTFVNIFIYSGIIFMAQSLHVKKRLDKKHGICNIISMTQGELAKKYGISRQYLNGVLRGRIIPSIKLAEKMAQDPEIGRSFFELKPQLKELLRRYI